MRSLVLPLPGRPGHGMVPFLLEILFPRLISPPWDMREILRLPPPPRYGSLSGANSVPFIGTALFFPSLALHIGTCSSLLQQAPFSPLPASTSSASCREVLSFSAAAGGAPPFPWRAARALGCHSLPRVGAVLCWSRTAQISMLFLTSAASSGWPALVPGDRGEEVCSPLNLDFFQLRESAE